MRVTNSMIVNNFMNNLNTNLTRLDKLETQLASGRKFAHISDDPTALIYSQAARNKLARLSHYQRTIGTAQDWLASVESGLMELEGRVADVYVSVLDAATDVKGSSDKNNVAQLVAQLRDHYLDTLNATFGDKFIYAGYNTPGDSSTGKITGPFTIDNNWNLYYNGHPLSNMVQIQIGGNPVLPDNVGGIFGGLRIDISDISDTAAIDKVIASVFDTVDEINNILPDIETVNASINTQEGNIADLGIQISASQSIIERLDGEIANLPENLSELAKLQADRDAEATHLRDLQQQESTAKAGLSETYTDRDTLLASLSKLLNTDPPEYDVDGRVALSVGGIELIGYDTPPELLEVDPGIVTPGTPPDIPDMRAILEMMNTLKADVLTFDVGPGISMDVTFNGIELVMFQAPDNTTMNIFNLLHEVYESASSGAPAEDLGKYITSLQYAQNHLLAKTAEVGGRTNRLDLLTARYEQDNLNYTQMMSNAEDADMADVIMYQKMAEAVYQAALSAGARIIQPTLMDFLR